VKVKQFSLVIRDTVVCFWPVVYSVVHLVLLACGLQCCAFIYQSACTLLKVVLCPVHESPGLSNLLLQIQAMTGFTQGE